MKYINIAPPEYVERKFLDEVFTHLEPHYNDDISFCVRNWQQESNFDDRKRIVVVTSAEGHKYIPGDHHYTNCEGAFAHYFPKCNKLSHSCYSSGFLLQGQPGLYALPLGCTSFFEGNSDIPFQKREHNFSFVGQLDPYRRMDFYHALKRMNSEWEGLVHLYEGWNNGVGGEEYSRIMSNTKVALVPWGSASLDTFRFYEAARCGCVVLCAPQNTYEFLEGSPHIEINSWDKIDRYLDEILSDPVEAAAIGQSTYDFWKNNLSAEASAQYIISKTKQEK